MAEQNKPGSQDSRKEGQKPVSNPKKDSSDLSTKRPQDKDINKGRPSQPLGLDDEEDDSVSSQGQGRFSGKESKRDSDPSI